MNELDDFLCEQQSDEFIFNEEEYDKLYDLLRYGFDNN